MANTRIQELAATVLYPLSQIEQLKTIANLTDSETEKIVRIAHEAKHEDLQPIIDIVSLAKYLTLSKAIIANVDGL